MEAENGKLSVGGSLSHRNIRAQFLPNGINDPGELNRLQLALLQPGRICHVESLFLGSFRQPTP